MKINEGLAIHTNAVLLVPYEAHHVPRYHSWMQDPAIREATASEELSLQEEFENQHSWRRSHDKLTFILCTPPPLLLTLITAGRDDAQDRMIGDVNFFLYPYDDEEEQEHEGHNGQGDEGGALRNGDEREILVRGEVDIMIAEQEARGRGAGGAAVRAVLAFVARHMADLLDEYAAGERGRWDAEDGRVGARDGGVGGGGRRMRLVELMVKIKEGNANSVRLFGALGFQQEGGVDYFGEVKMVLPWDSARRAVRDEATRLAYQELVYAPPL